MKNYFKLAIVATCTLASATAAAQDVPFYTPDVVAAETAEALTVSANSTHASALPSVTGFWTDMVNAEVPNSGGSGVYVAVLDTGMLPEAPFFFSQADIAWDLGKGFSHDVYWDDDQQTVVIGPVDGDRGFWTDLASGHGTHVTSTITGFNVNNAFWVDGAAPDVTIIPVLCLDAWEVPSPFGTLQFSGGTDEMIASAIAYVADLSDTLDGPVVINMSLGGPTPSLMIESAIDYAIAKGVVVVVSAGNSGTDGLGYPGGLPQVISAGAAGWADMFTNSWTGDVPENIKTQDALGNKRPFYLEDFSSRPNKSNNAQKHWQLDVTAPGAFVVGPFKSDFANDTNYYYLSGTSMASPHVAATAATVLSDHPHFTQSDVEAVLRNAAAGNSMPTDTATVAFPFDPAGFYTASWGGGDYGKGFLMIDDALAAAANH